MKTIVPANNDIKMVALGYRFSISSHKSLDLVINKQCLLFIVDDDHFWFQNEKESDIFLTNDYTFLLHSTLIFDFIFIVIFPWGLLASCLVYDLSSSSSYSKLIVWGLSIGEMEWNESENFMIIGDLHTKLPVRTWCSFMFLWFCLFIFYDYLLMFFDILENNWWMGFVWIIVSWFRCVGYYFFVIQLWCHLNTFV